MKRAEFMDHFVQARKRHYQNEIDAGRMRLSEAMMGMADAQKDAKALWRRNGIPTEPCQLRSCNRNQKGLSEVVDTERK